MGMGVGLQVGVLGPVVAVLNDAEVELGPPLQRAVFAVLAARPDQVVSIGELIQAVWGERSPASVEGSVHTYVAALRRGLAEADQAGAGLLVSSRAGYRLRVPAGGLDCQLVEEARSRGARLRIAANLVDAVDAFDGALTMFRGSPFSGVPGPFAEVERTRWAEVRLGLVEARAECLLALGRPREVVAELPALIEAHPLRETLRELMMLGLYQSGRAGEALDEFQRARRLMVSQTGIDPGPRLRQLEDQILHNDPALRPPPVKPAAAGSARPTVASGSARLRVPAQLPHGMADFTGRAQELTSLRELLAGYDDGPAGAQGPVLITAIDGAGGIGKTALAVQFAHEVAPRYPDGQLYVNLRGFVPGQAPARAEDTLGQFLVGLGFAGIPADLDERAALFRSTLAARRMLVLLDNAVSAEQVRPLLPGGGSSLVLVTSRNRLGGLVARDGARRLTLDTLPPQDSVALLAAILGRDRVAAEPASAVTLAGLCGHLPLALRVAGERAAMHPGSPLSELVEELRDQHGRLDLLSAGEDEYGAVAAVLSWSYLSLKPEAARVFRLLGLHAGPDLSLPAAAALAGTGKPLARRLLGTLADGHLIEPAGRDRYRFHDLLRVYAAECAADDESGQDRDAAMRRVLEWYLHTAAAGYRALRPDRTGPELPQPDAAYPPLDLVSVEQAMDWFDAERFNLIAAVTQAADCGMHDVAWKLTLATSEYFGIREDGFGRLSTGLIGVESARRLGDQVAECRTLTSVGVAYNFLDRVDDALDAHGRALAISRQIGARGLEAMTLMHLGFGYHRLGRNSGDNDALTESAKYFEQAGTLAEAMSLPVRQAFAFGGLAETRLDLTQFEAAMTAGRRALNAAQQLDDHRQRDRYSAWAQTLVAKAYEHLDLFDQALEAYQSAAARFDGAGDLASPSYQAEALWRMAELQRRLGRHAEAIISFEQAHTLYQRITDVENTRWHDSYEAVQDALAAYQKTNSAMTPNQTNQR
jgi:DNA-binding SARP family transcriptional activator/tetratricopeptide (TPR) repeat protein